MKTERHITAARGARLLRLLPLFLLACCANFVEARTQSGKSPAPKHSPVAAQSPAPKTTATAAAAAPLLKRTTTRHEIRRLGYGGTLTVYGAPEGSITIEGW
ncbi:MAG TPA: hypothetical protein VF754_01760, partial [Pyrinomonadaceae bacterium]